MPKLKDTPKIDRPREKLIKYGPNRLSTSELLAIILGTGIRGTNVIELANKILKKIGSINLKEVKFNDLIEISGLGPVKACEIIACIEIGKRLLKDKKTALIMKPLDVWGELKDIRNHKKEHFVVFYLDSRYQEIKREIISIGTLDENLIHPREVFEPAIINNAAQVIIAHNHPSGNVEPSNEDIAITKRLTDAGKILGIEILDHIIVGSNGYLSLKEKNLLK